MKSLKKYIHLWVTLSLNSFQISLTHRFNAGIFLLGKVLRFGFFSIFILTLFTRTQLLGNYTEVHVVFFFLTFTILDTITQLLFREVYRFRPMVVSGDFDLVLVKPMSPLFRALVGGADILDLIMSIPYIGAAIYVGSLIPGITWTRVIVYLLLLSNGFLIATGFHILVLALAIVTTEIDHAVMIYRDLTSMGRVPVDIYQEPLRSIITFAVPIGIMMTFPAKAFLGLLTLPFIVISFVSGIIFFLMCLRIWRYALSQYASASS